MKGNTPYSIVIPLFLILSLLMPPELRASSPSETEQEPGSNSDRQLLLNGRIWRNKHLKVSGNQFFLSGTFMTGSVTFNGRIYKDLELLYDLADDELILRYGSYPVIILNKEMVDSFTVSFNGREYYFINTGNISSSLPAGYINILYNGPTAVFVRYVKKIKPLAVDGRTDLFYQEHKIFIRKGTSLTEVKGRKDFLKILGLKKAELRDLLHNHGYSNGMPGRKDPDLFAAIAAYYDSLP
ncbi:MAG: hypothetical protein RBT38_02750 [Bacteroidales bacterium]|jgi:hypothetical protein|nr:hypothetical protein [Bacteroidales bacterium]